MITMNMLSIMNRFILFSYVIFNLNICMQAQELQPITLNAPDKTRGLSVMEALSVRASVREWSEEKLNQL